MNQTQSIPIACELSEEEQKRALDAYKSGLFSHVEEVRQRPGGYSLRFTWGSDRIRELSDFVALDSSCCSFLDHGMEIPRGKKEIWLHITGPTEARDVLRSELALLLPEGLSLPLGGTPARTVRFGWGALGASGVGLLAILCCAAPAIGVFALAMFGAWFVPSSLVFGLTAGLGVLAWVVLRRRGKHKSMCCG
jgi:hypothetical protein